MHRSTLCNNTYSCMNRCPIQWCKLDEIVRGVYYTIYNQYADLHSIYHKIILEYKL